MYEHFISFQSFIDFIKMKIQVVAEILSQILSKLMLETVKPFLILNYFIFLETKQMYKICVRSLLLKYSI